MPPPKLITDEMMPEVLKLAGQGKSASEIATWLQSEHGVTVSVSAVQKRLGKVARERAPIAQAIVRDALAKTLTPDLAALDGILERARKIEEAAKKNDDLADEIERLAKSDIGQLFDENDRFRRINPADPTDKTAMSEDARRTIASIEVEELFDVSAEGGRIPVGVTKKVKLWDKNAALKLAAALRSKGAESATALAAQDRQLRALELRFKLSGATTDPNETQGLIVLPAETPDE